MYEVDCCYFWVEGKVQLVVQCGFQVQQLVCVFFEFVMKVVVLQQFVVVEGVGVVEVDLVFEYVVEEVIFEMKFVVELLIQVGDGV